VNSFAMIFGRCVWIPPSPKAALMALSYFYGAVLGGTPADYEAALRTQLVAAGSTEEAATAEVRWLKDCFASYVVPNNQRRSLPK
jgi:hypothetical protein